MEEIQPCLITNALGPPGALWECQVVDPTKVSTKKLKKFWVLPSSFDWNCPANTVWLRADWVESSRERYNAWTWVPPIETLRIIEERLRLLRTKKRNAPWNVVYPDGPRHRYTFVPLHLDSTIITRLPSPSPSPNLQSTITNHHPPYTALPDLRHGCHPYFVIQNATSQFEIQARLQELSDEMLRLYARLRLVWSLWEEVAEFPVLYDDESEEVFGGRMVEVDMETGQGRVVERKERRRHEDTMDEMDTVETQGTGTIKEDVERDSSVFTLVQGGGGAAPIVITVDEDIKPDITRLEALRTRQSHHDIVQRPLPTSAPAIHAGNSVDIQPITVQPTVTENNTAPLPSQRPSFTTSIQFGLPSPSTSASATRINKPPSHPSPQPDASSSSFTFTAVPSNIWNFRARASSSPSRVTSPVPPSSATRFSPDSLPRKRPAIPLKAVMAATSIHTRGHQNPDVSGPQPSCLDLVRARVEKELPEHTMASTSTSTSIAPPSSSLPINYAAATPGTNNNTASATISTSSFSTSPVHPLTSTPTASSSRQNDDTVDEQDTNFNSHSRESAALASPRSQTPTQPASHLRSLNSPAAIPTSTSLSSHERLIHPGRWTDVSSTLLARAATTTQGVSGSSPSPSSPSIPPSAYIKADEEKVDGEGERPRKAHKIDEITGGVEGTDSTEGGAGSHNGKRKARASFRSGHIRLFAPGGSDG